MTTKFETFLNSFDESDWLSALESMLSNIHEVDRAATQVWFRFYPLSLFQYLKKAEDTSAALHGFAMQGNHELKNQIDSSPHFLYGHRFWNSVKKVILKRAENFSGANDLVIEVKQIAQDVANEEKSRIDLTLGISFVGLMTLVQVGLENFQKATSPIKVEDSRTPSQIVAARAKDDSQGLFGFLKTVDKKYTIAFSSITKTGSFRAYNQQEITSAAMNCDVQTDDRCVEGPIPVECKSAACGTCWVGVLGGAEKISAVTSREARAMKIFGYNQPDGSHPFLRLSCQSKISGNVTIVIPPWNGVFGRKVYGVEEVTLEPATTSAKKLRETISEAIGK